MNIFVCEYITGGGLYREPLPESLAQEGGMMRDALLRDLHDLPDINVTTTHDARLQAPDFCPSVQIGHADDPWLLWQQLMKAADAVWVIAPESGQILSRFAELTAANGIAFIGSDAATIKLTTSKHATLHTLADAGIPVVPVIDTQSACTPTYPQVVAKPDDGAGCDETVMLSGAPDVQSWMAMHPFHILQPYYAGRSGSMSMLCCEGRCYLLSCNEQKIKMDKQGRLTYFRYGGSILNGFHEYWMALEQLAQQVAQALPGLRGYVGVDFIINESHSEPMISLLEINPRLTTSYAGLHKAIGYNPARLVLDMLYNPAFTMPDLQRRRVEISLDA